MLVEVARGQDTVWYRLGLEGIVCQPLSVTSTSRMVSNFFKLYINCFVTFFSYTRGKKNQENSWDEKRQTRNSQSPGFH